MKIIKTPLFCRDLERKNEEGEISCKRVVWGGWRDIKEEKKRRKRGGNRGVVNNWKLIGSIFSTIGFHNCQAGIVGIISGDTGYTGGRCFLTELESRQQLL